MSGDAGAIAGPPRGLRGPSAISGNWRQFWDLLIITSTAAFRQRYVNTVFGFVWMFLGPLLLFAVLYVFVVEIIQRFSDTPNYGQLLLLNIVLFNFFRLGTTAGMRSLVGSASPVRKMEVPRLVLPLSAVATAFYVTCANMVVVVAWVLIAGIEPTWTWLLFPLLVVAMVVIVTGTALLLAGIFVRFRDIAHVWPPMLQVAFYASPVIWPFGFVKASILWEAQTYNPLAPVLAQARVWIIDPSAEGWFDARGTGFDAFVPFIILVLIWVIGAMVFAREARRAAEDL